MTEAEFVTGLRPRFGGDDFVLVPQVRNGTGFGRLPRTADALACSLWPSRGIDVHGFEFKDSRADWLRELKDPAKADEIGKYCAFWWLCVSDPEIVRPDELPAAWGCLHVTPDSSKVVTKAPRRETVPPTWSFVAAAFKAAKDVVTDEAEVQRRIRLAVAKSQDGHYEAVKQAREKGVKEGEKSFLSLKARVDAFEAASGVRIDEWRSQGRIGEAVRLVLDGGTAGLRTELERIVHQADRIRAAAAAVLAEGGPS